MLNLAAGAVADSPPPVPASSPADDHALDLGDVRGQAFARRALEVAAAGGHNLLMVGPPGAGKTMLARRMPGILPPLLVRRSPGGDRHPLGRGRCSRPARASCPSGPSVRRITRSPTRRWSAAAPSRGQARSASPTTACSSSTRCPSSSGAFSTRMRQPLEEGRITVSRAARSVVFPARFMLVAAMNPCPCGYLGSVARPCRCTPMQVAKYRSRISGPLRDRLDLIVEVDAVPISTLSAPPPASEVTAAVRPRIAAARAPAGGSARSTERPPVGAVIGPELPLEPEREGLARVVCRTIPAVGPGLPPGHPGRPDHRGPGRLRCRGRRPSCRGPAVSIRRMTAIKGRNL